MSVSKLKAKPVETVLLKADDVVFQASEDSDGLIRLAVLGPVALKVRRENGKLQVSFETPSVTLRGGGKTGRLRLNARTWDDAKVVLPGQSVGLDVQAGQVVATKRGG